MSFKDEPKGLEADGKNGTNVDYKAHRGFGGSDAKSVGDFGAADKASEDVRVDVTQIQLTPNHCAVSDPLDIEIDYNLSSAVRDAAWRFQFMVDSAHERHIIELGMSPRSQILDAGDNSVLFSVSHIDVSGIRPGALTNCGLLTASLFGGDVAIMDVNMVTMVEQHDGEFIRNIYSPLE